MRSQLAILIAAAVLAAGCHGGSDTAKRKDQQYNVVQEGQASGVTSTISGPGETPPPVNSTPLTTTYADTTTNFTINPNAAAPANGQPGSIASTLPPPNTTTAQVPMSGPIASGAPGNAPPPTSRQRVVVAQPQPQRTTTTTTTQQAPLPPMTSATPPPSTDTSKTTTTATESKEKKDKPKQDEGSKPPETQTAPPPTDTQPPANDSQPAPPPPPPPPTSTDTQGNPPL